MIPAEKRKYDRVKRLRARDKSDMIAGNQAVEISDASQVLAGDTPQESVNNNSDEEAAQATSVEEAPQAISRSGTSSVEASHTVITTTYTIQGASGPGGQGEGVPIITTQVITLFPTTSGSQTTTTAKISKSTSDGAILTGTPDSESSSSEGLSNGAKIGIGVAVPLVFIILGLGIFFFFRRRKHQRFANKEGGVGEVMITGGKHHDEDGSSGGVAGSPTGYHSNVAPQAGAVPGADPVPIGAPVPRSRTQEDDDDLMNRPVSPVHDDDLLTGEASSSHSVTRSGTALGGSVRDRGSPSLDDDREMQWILEEERKAKERREQQGRLPTHT